MTQVGVPERMHLPTPISWPSLWSKGTSTQQIDHCQSIVKTLLANGATVRSHTKAAGPPLHLASLIGSRTLVQTLLDEGVDINEIGGFLNMPYSLRYVEATWKSYHSSSNTAQSQTICTLNMALRCI